MDVIHCSRRQCLATRRNNKFAAIRSHEEGWFEGKDGRIWCPEHIPQWAVEYRAKKKSEGSEKQ